MTKKKKIQFCPGLDAWIRFQISLDTARKVKSFQLCNDTYASQKCCPDWVRLQNHNIGRRKQHTMSDDATCICCPETRGFESTSSRVPVLNELRFTVLSILAFHRWLICRKVVPWRENTASTVLISKTYFANGVFLAVFCPCRKTAFVSRTCHLAKNLPRKHKWEESYEKVRTLKNPQQAWLHLLGLLMYRAILTAPPPGTKKASQPAWRGGMITQPKLLQHVV